MNGVLLNVDLGERPYEDEELYACARIANIACGGHAGDDASIGLALDRCARHRVAVGAHPSYPDRDGFGRRRMAIAPGALERSVAEQCARLERAASASGLVVTHVKAHGALYHAATTDTETAGALVRGVVAALGSGVTVIGSGAHGSHEGAAGANALTEQAARAKLAFAREGFADRGVRNDGTLVPRGEPGALVTDPALAAARALDLARSGAFDTIGVHGDTPGASGVARAVRAALDALAGEGDGGANTRTGRR